MRCKEKRIATLAAFITAAALLAAGAAPGEDSVKEDKYSFNKVENFGGKKHILLGTGMRYKSILVKLEIYEAGLYIEEEKGLKAWKDWVTKYGSQFLEHASVAGSEGKPNWSRIKSSPKFFFWLASRPFGHAIVMKFRYSVSDRQIRDAYAETLARTIPDLQASDVKDAVKTFLDGVSHPIKKGETMTVRSMGNKIYVSGPGGSIEVENAKLRRAMWNIWLGPKPIQEPLKNRLVRLAEVLGWPQ